MKVGQQNERKFISVMICDIAGSYEFLYGQDPEDGKAVIDAAVELMLDVVREYDGRVSQVQGDGLMVLFGAPDATEDHAERACLTALDMVARFTSRNHKLEWPFESQIYPKIGVSSGEAIVGQSVPTGELKPDGVPEYIAVGAVSHLAGKLQKLAQPGDIVVADSTADLIRSNATLEKLTNVPVHERIPNHPDPYLLKSISTVSQQWRSDKSRSPFVGREEQLYTLSQLARKTLSGHGATVVIQGQAGIGKSRLVYEFINHYLAREMHAIVIRCESLRRNTPYSPMRSMVRKWFSTVCGFEEPSDELLETATKALGIAEPQSIVPLLHLAFVDYQKQEWDNLEPGIKRTRIVAALDQLIFSLAKGRPLVVVVEDLHWADVATREYVDQLANSAEEHSFMLLVTHRGQEKITAKIEAEVNLQTLDSADATAIAQFHLGLGDTTDAWLGEILERCGGVPLFIEELAKSVDSANIPASDEMLSPTVDVPDFLRVIIASRVDQLPQNAKQLLKVASVLGIGFVFDELAEHYTGSREQLDDSLDLLLKSGILVAGETAIEYRFKHALLQEVVYAGLVRSECKSVHLSILCSLKDNLQSDPGNRIYQLLCYHARYADQWNDLLQFSVAAGSDAMVCASYKEALHFYQQAIDALNITEVSEKDRQACLCWLEVSRACIPLGDIVGAFSALNQSKKAALKSAEAERICEIGLYEVCLLTLLKDAPTAAASGVNAIKVAEEAQSIKYRLGARIYHAQSLFYAGEFNQVVAILAPLIEGPDFQQFGDMQMGNSAVVGIDAFGNLAMAYSQLGEFDKAIVYGEKSCEVAEADGGSLGIGLANFYLTYILVHQGQMKRSQRSLETVRSLIESGGILFLSPWLNGLLGFIHAKEGRTELAKSLIDLSVEESQRMSLKMSECYAVVSQSMLSLDCGEINAAEVTACEAMELARSGGFQSIEVWVDRLRARIAFTSGRDIDGHELLDNASQRAESLGMRPDLAHCHLIRAQQHHDSGNTDRARTSASLALSMYEDMQMLRWIPDARAILESLSDNPQSL